MKVLMINSVCGIRSTGRICTDLADALERQGHEVKIAYGRETVPQKYQKYAIRIGSDFSVKADALKTRLFDNAGFNSKSATKKFLKWVDKYDPDIIHLHNLHGYYINVQLLFDHFKKANKKVIWTLHDCWAFTGHCSHFDAINCEKWKTKCSDCPKKKAYPRAYVDRSRVNYEKKKQVFSSVPDMTIVTPSKWLADLVKESFLGDYSVEVIHNGIDLNIFKPTESNFREKYGLESKKIVLGVASAWGKSKGLYDFVKLSGMLDDNYKIVLVGLTKEQISEMPKNIICIERTNNAKELAEIYTAADVFVNPTYCDTYPTVNLEAQACGTPVITYRTGGSPESVEQNNVVECGNVDKFIKHINLVCKNCENSKVDIRNFDSQHAVEKYIAIYQ